MKLWQAFYAIYPLPQDREDLQHANTQFKIDRGVLADMGRYESYLPYWYYPLTTEQEKQRVERHREAKMLNEQAAFDRKQQREERA